MAYHGETSEELAACCCETLMREFEELETKCNEDVSNERNSPTVSRYPPHISPKRVCDFMPRVVSIGPFFHGECKLRDMEMKKAELMLDLLSTKYACALLPDLTMKVGELLDGAKKFYGGNIEFEDCAFAKMLLLDSCFIIFFLVSMISQQRHEKLISLDWNIREIRSDLLLYGNQIPLFVVSNIYYIIQKSCKEKNLPRYFNETIGEFIQMDVSWDVRSSLTAVPLCITKTNHLLDLYWLSYIPEEIGTRLRYQEIVNMHEYSYAYADVDDTWIIPSATELNKVAGVTFNLDKLSRFTPSFRYGSITMPSIKIDENMKMVITNLLVYEQNLPVHRRKVSSHMLLMHFLITTEADVALLQKSGIIVNGFESNLKAARFFNEIGNMCVVDYENHYCTKLFKDIQKHYKSTSKRSWARLLRDYYTTPWAKFISNGSGITLILTFIQTITGIIQTYYTAHPPKN